MKNIAIILAGGSGSRFGDETPKQFIILHGRRVIDYSVNIFYQHNEIDEIIGLELGADDYIYKPISIHKLKSRIKVILKRYQSPPLISSSLN